MIDIKYFVDGIKCLCDDIKWEFDQRIYYPISEFLHPRQRWIKKYITYKKWCDKDILLQDFLAGCIIEFKENEMDSGIVDYDADDEHSEFRDGMVSAYEWFKYERPQKHINITKMYGDDDVAYEDIVEVENQIHELDTHYLKWVIENRGYMWT